MSRRLAARLAMVGVALLYVLALQWVYVDFVSPRFAYQGMFARDLPVDIVIWQLVAGPLPAFALPVDVRKPSQFQVLLLFLVVYVPSVVIGYHICQPPQWSEYSAFIALSGVMLSALSQVGRIPPLSIPMAGLTPIGSRIAFALFCVAVYGALIAYYGLPADLTDVGAIYLSRADFKAKVLEAPSILQYLYFWQGLVLNPALIVIGLLRRRFGIALIGAALEYLLFAVTSLRGIALGIFFSTFIVWFFYRRRRLNGLQFVALIWVAMVAGGLLMSTEGPLGLASSLFVQRWLTMQGQLSGAYIDFFAQHDKILFGDSLLRNVVHYPYQDLTPGQVIGDLYVSMGTGGIDNAPANIWADAYGQLGYAGPVLATLFAAVLLWLIDSVFRGLRYGLGIMLFASCALSMTAQGVQTSVLTGGALPLLVIGLLGRQYLTRIEGGSEIRRAHDIGP